ncbi:MAG TPA: protoporphyrinogen oxidase [bacterium]|jgi:oxygen-dependent protoporphyrinogen oxidase
MSADAKSAPRIIVIGGGIAGLATAYLLQELGRENGKSVQITVLEALDVAGGSTRTDLDSGFTCEWGPNGFLDNEPATLELVKRLNLTDDLVRADESASKRFIYYGGKMREVPVKPPAFLTSNILPFGAKLRIAMELFVPAKRNGHEETVHSFGVRRLGRTFADFLLDPMVSGIFAGNTKELSLPAVFPKMVEMERDYGGLFRAMIAKGREAKKTGKVSGGPAGANAVLHTFKRGMGELTETLLRALNATIRTSTPAEAIELKNNVWTVKVSGEVLEADAVIMACPSYAAADMIRGLSPKAADAIGQIPFAPVEVVCHGHRAEDLGHSLHGFGVLIPRSEGVRSLGTLWSDSIFPGQAPKGVKLLRTLIGGAHDPGVTQMSTSEIERTAEQDHQTLYHVKNPPVFRKVIRHEKGIAQYTIGHPARVAAIDALERETRGLYFTGASYRGVSINGCVKDAFRVARNFWDNWRPQA